MTDLRVLLEQASTIAEGAGLVFVSGACLGETVRDLGVRAAS